MISVSIFLVSLTGLVALVSFRAWEMKREVRPLEKHRARLDAATRGLGERAASHVPTFDLHFLARGYHKVVHLAALAALFVLRAIERQIFRVLEYVRGKREVKHGVTGSDFLKSVSEHKQSLGKPEADGIE